MSKKDNIILFAIILVISGFVGWLYEVVFYYFNGGMNLVYNRGICFLPWIDIYAFGSLMIYLLTRKDTKWYISFIKSGIVCGVIEYLAGFLIYTLFDGSRPWDYSTEILNFGNINGFVCVRSVLIFAVFGVILMYFMIPIIKKLLNSKYKNIIGNIFIILCAIVFLDEVYNMLCYLNVLPFSSASDIYKSFGINYW